MEWKRKKMKRKTGIPLIFSVCLFLCAPGMGAVYRVRVPNHEGSSNG